MNKVIVSVTTQNRGPMIFLKDPVGVRVNKGRTDLTRGVIFVVDHPKPGVWKLFVSPGAGKHSYVVKGSGTANLDFDFIFVNPRGKMPPLPVHPVHSEEMGSPRRKKFPLLGSAHFKIHS